MRAVTLLEEVTVGVWDVKCVCFATLESDCIVSVPQPVEFLCQAIVVKYLIIQKNLWFV